jgi:hypothetical protein
MPMYALKFQRRPVSETLAVLGGEESICRVGQNHKEITCTIELRKLKEAYRGIYEPVNK